MAGRAKAVAVTTPGDSALPPPPPEERVASDSIARNTLFATVNGVLSAAFAAVLTLYLVRRARPARLRRLHARARCRARSFALVMDFGISSSAGRFIAERRGDRRAIADYVADALRLKVVIAGLLGVVLFVARRAIADLYGKPGLTWPLRGVALALVGSSLMQLYGAALVAQARRRPASLMTFAQSGGFLVASVALVSPAPARRAPRSGGRSATASAVVGRLGGDRQAVRAPCARDRLVAKGRTRQIAAYAGVLAVVEGAYLFFDQLDALLIGAYLKSAAAVGLFQAAFGLTVFMHYPAGVVATSVAPRVAGHHGARLRRRALRDTRLRFLIVGYAALLAPAARLGGPIVDLLLGLELRPARRACCARSPRTCSSAASVRFLSPAANYLGQARKRLPLALAAVRSTSSSTSC